jgi:AraC family transcriptional activator of pobA
MEPTAEFWHFSNMTQQPDPAIPAYALYGEGRIFPDLLHVERITDRAAQHDWRISPHRNPHLHQFFLIRSGKTVITVDGASETLAPPTLVNIPPWTVHGFRFAKGTDGHVLTIPVAELPEIFADQTVSARLEGWGTCPADDETCALFDLILTEHGAAGFARLPLLRALATQIGCRVAEALGAARTPPGPGHDNRMAAFEALVRNHLRDHYAGALSVTPTHLSRITRAATGLPPSRYIDALLFQEACRQLAYTRLNVTTIGYLLGFEDPAYFSRAFRRQTGMSPREYRQRVNSGPKADA